MRPFLTPLKVISTEKGVVRHALKAHEESFTKFGEAYFSEVDYNAVKGWKLHTRMQMNLIIPFGSVKFCVRSKQNDWSKVFQIGVENYCRLTVPPEYWLAFKGMNAGTNIVLNISDIEHDPDEVIQAPLHTYEFE